MKQKSETDVISLDEAMTLLSESPIACTPESTPLAAGAQQDSGAIPHHLEFGVMRPSKYRALLRGFINVVEAEGRPVTVDVSGTHPTVHADLTPYRQLTGNLRTKDHTQQDTASTLNNSSEALSPRKHLSFRERWQSFKTERQASREPAKPRLGLRRALGALATVGLLIGGSVIVRSGVPESSTVTEAAPAVATYVESNTPSSIASAEQMSPTFTEEEARAVITIASGRYAVELAHPEYTQAQVDQQFMATLDFAVMVQQSNIS